MAKSTSGRSLQDLLDRAEIDDVIHRYATGIDNRDWALLRSIFADEAVFETRSWTGGEPKRMRADDWVKWAEGMLAGFDATRHYSSNHVHTIVGDHATCVSNMVALHYLQEGEERNMHASFGTYTRGLKRTYDGWIIDAHQLVIVADMGERALHTRAQARWAARQAN